MDRVSAAVLAGVIGGVGGCLSTVSTWVVEVRVCVHKQFGFCVIIQQRCRRMCVRGVGLSFLPFSVPLPSWQALLFGVDTRHTSAHTCVSFC